MRLSWSGPQFSSPIKCRRKMQKVLVVISADGWKNVRDLIIDRIALNMLNVFYDILVISKIDFTELFKNNNYGFHDYIS